MHLGCSLSGPGWPAVYATQRAAESAEARDLSLPAAAGLWLCRWGLVGPVLGKDRRQGLRQ